jgi:hypothetical protein
MGARLQYVRARMSRHGCGAERPACAETKTKDAPLRRLGSRGQRHGPRSRGCQSTIPRRAVGDRRSGRSDAAVNAGHRRVARFVVRSVRGESLVERAHQAHLRNGPQLAAPEVTRATRPAQLNGAKNLVTRTCEAMAVRGDDASVSLVGEREQLPRSDGLAEEPEHRRDIAHGRMRSGDRRSEPAAHAEASTRRAPLEDSSPRPKLTAWAESLDPLGRAKERASVLQRATEDSNL